MSLLPHLWIREGKWTQPYQSIWTHSQTLTEQGRAKVISGEGETSCSVVTLRVLSQWDRMDGHPEYCREATGSMYASMWKSCPASETA